MNDLLAYLAVLLALVGAAFAWWLMRSVPRLRLDPTLRGTTRSGSLFVLVHNDGLRPARNVELRVAWATNGQEQPIDSIVIPEVEPRSATTVRVDDLHRGVPEGARFDRIVAVARAPRARGARATLDLVAREQARAPDAPAVQYRPLTEACPNSPDGQHRLVSKTVTNDGVDETWDACRRCGYVKRRPITAEQQATQARVRRERAAQEQRRLDEEFARASRTGSEPPPAGGRSPPPEVRDEMPVSIAFWILGLDERASWEDVEAAHKRLAKDAHPDRAGPVDARVRGVLEERMRDLNRARDRLREHFREG